MDEEAQVRDPLADLVARTREGDEGAFETLYDGLYGCVWSFAVRRARRRVDAEDIVARTFHRFVEHLDAFDSRRGSVRAFVLSIARNLLIDDARAHRASVPIDDVQVADLATPLAGVLRDEEIVLLRRELERLSVDARELIDLRFGAGLRFREIAQLLGVRESAVKQRFSRLMRQLRESVAHAQGEVPT